VALAEAGFVVGLVKVCGGRAVGLLVVLTGAAVAAADVDDELPSGAVESIVIC
jgi:hypothetical protein